MLENEKPWKKEGLTQEEKEKAFDDWVADRENVLKRFKEEEKEFVKSTAERLHQAKDEETFLSIVNELEKDASKIKETVVLFPGEST